MRWCNFSLARLGDVRTRIRPVMLARLGSRDAADVLPRIILEYQSQRASRMLRDLIVTVTTLAVVDQFGLPLTTRSPRRRNACEIVAMALGSVGISIGHKGVGTDAPASRLLLAGRRCSGRPNACMRPASVPAFRPNPIARPKSAGFALRHDHVRSITVMHDA